MDYFAYNNKTAIRSNKETDFPNFRLIAVLCKAIILEPISYLINFR